MRSLFPAVAFTLSAMTALAVAATPRWTGDPALGPRDLEQQWKLVGDPDTPVPIRGVLRFAVEATGLGWHPERVAAALARARAMQDLDPASKTRGNFRWHGRQPGVVDLNAVEFAAQLLGFMGRHQADRLSADAHRLLEDMMADAITGLRSHVVKIEYTNIFVMKAWGLIAIGETLGRADVAEDGYRRFDDWVRFTAQHGLAEYGAVTYYGIDLDSLALLAQFAGRADARAKAQRAIRLLWTDAAANWWAPGDRLGGTNARTYDYLFGSGYFEAHTWTAGWLRARPELEGAGWISMARENLTTFREAVTRPPPAEWTEAIRAQVPRTVVQRWGDRPEQLAVNWIGRHVSLASSGASHSRDERTLVANLGDSPAVPQLMLLMDGRGDPYGTKKTVGGKALHLTPLVATVQRGPEVLQVLSDNPLAPGTRAKPGELSCFLTHFTVPAVAQLWIGDTRTEPGSPANPVLVPPDAAVFVRLGDAVIGLRVLLATTIGGGRAPVQWIEDDKGGVARRLTVVHATTAPQGRGTLAVWLRAADGLDEAGFAAWRKKFSAAPATARLAGDLLVAEAAGDQGPLRIAADVAKGERRVLAGGEAPALLSINGRDVGREVMQEFLSR
jgi:hypothetical protein